MIFSGFPGRVGTLFGPISFIFMQFAAKILPSNGFFGPVSGIPPSQHTHITVWEILDPPLKITKILNKVCVLGWNCADSTF